MRAPWVTLLVAVGCGGATSATKPAPAPASSAGARGPEPAPRPATVDLGGALVLDAPRGYTEEKVDDTGERHLFSRDGSLVYMVMRPYEGPPPATDICQINAEGFTVGFLGGILEQEVSVRVDNRVDLTPLAGGGVWCGIGGRLETESGPAPVEAYHWSLPTAEAMMVCFGEAAVLCRDLAASARRR